MNSHEWREGTIIDKACHDSPYSFKNYLGSDVEDR